VTPNELLEWRTAARLSQPGLAALLDVDKMTIWRWENGQRAIPPYLHLALDGLTARAGYPAPATR
jgi:transcriptional regulator with XRE-family HTH domain